MQDRLDELVRQARQIRSEADRLVADIGRDFGDDFDSHARSIQERAQALADGLHRGIGDAEGR